MNCEPAQVTDRDHPEFLNGFKVVAGVLLGFVDAAVGDVDVGVDVSRVSHFFRTIFYFSRKSCSLEILEKYQSTK